MIWMCATKELLDDVIIPTVHTGPEVIPSLHNFVLRVGWRNSFLFPYKRSTETDLWAVVLNEVIIFPTVIIGQNTLCINIPPWLHSKETLLQEMHTGNFDL